MRRKVHGKLNASWKISSLAVNGQSFLVIDGYLWDFLLQKLSLEGAAVPFAIIRNEIPLGKWKDKNTAVKRES